MTEIDETDSVHTDEESAESIITSRSALVAINQTEFTLEALPTRRSGRTRRTRDTAEMYACICGDIVESEAKSRARTLLCTQAAGSMDAKHLGFISHAATIPAPQGVDVVSSMNAQSMRV